jgi:hypothetical protein
MTRVSTSTQCWRGSSTLFFLVIIQDSDCNPVPVDEELPVASYIKQSVLEFVFWGVLERSIRLLRVVSSLIVFWDSQNDATVTSCLMERFELPRARPFSSHSDTAVHAMSRTGMHRFLRKKRVLLWNFSCGSLSFVSWPWRLVRFGWIMSCYTSLVTTMDCFSYIASRQFISWPFLPLVPWPACIAASLS